MSATLTSTPVIDALMAAISCLSREEKAVLVERVQGEIHSEEEFPQWQMDIVEERLRRLDAGIDKAIPVEEAFKELDRKWGRKS
jgi:hypothetical protein